MTTALAVVFCVTLCHGLPSAFASAEADGIVIERVERSPAKTRAFWTAAEMAEATSNGSPAPQPSSTSTSTPSLRAEPTVEGDFTPSDPAAQPWRVHGKVFFRSDGESYSCSGTLIDSAGRNVVATAGHCVYVREAKSFVNNLAFVPAYDGSAGSSSEREPFGTWPAKKIATTRDWQYAGQLGADLAFFTVTGEPGRTLGGRKILFNNERTGRPVTIIGYPAEPRDLFDGRTMKGCRSRIVDRDTGRGTIFPAAFQARPCSMGAGSSGGGWVTGGGFLTSVVSYGYCPATPRLCDSTYGPVLGEAAKGIYTADAIGGSRTPSISIDRGPRSRAVVSTASFSVGGAGSTPVSLWCRIDTRKPKKCSGTITYRKLKPGPHVFSVRAIDQTGNRSSLLRRGFTIARG